ncbi:uncharacterized protein [Aegilops tauschii subsp. strangulata]|uniref:uncharacterized protein isoform X2 n=1 Tax=Aegilops tauschii subsp. strangulata TaxID=200361 RepID=UPI003CC86143
MVILGKGETLLSFGSLVTAGACILYIEKFKYPPLQYLHKNLFSTVSTKKMLLAYYMNSFLPTLSSVYLLREVLCWFVGLLSLTNKVSDFLLFYRRCYHYFFSLRWLVICLLSRSSFATSGCLIG